MLEVPYLRSPPIALLLRDCCLPSLLCECSFRSRLRCDHPKSYHRGGQHPTGSRDCTHWKREQEVINLSEEYKVTNQRAKQMIENNTVCNAITETELVFPTYFDLKFYCPEQKRKISLFLLDKCIQSKSVNKLVHYALKIAKHSSGFKE